MTTTDLDTELDLGVSVDPVVSPDAVISYAKLVQILNETENLTEQLFELGEDTLVFSFDEDDEDDPIKLKINSATYTLTADAIFQALSMAKIPKGLIDVYDIDILLPLVNWYYDNKEGEMKALTKDKRIVAFTRPGTAIYSTVEIVDEMVRALGNFDITEYHFDKVHHSLKETHFCLVAPHKSYALDEGEGDVLRAGIFVQHSVVGSKPTTMSGFVSRDYHENGMISAQGFEQWSRKKEKKTDDVTNEEDHFDIYTWAFDTADTMIRTFTNDAKSIEFLQTIEVGNHAGTLFNDVFEKNSLPVGIRKLVREEYVDQPGQTLYDLWNAITLVADRTELEDSPANRKKVMEAAGKLADHPQSCPNCHRLTEETGTKVVSSD